MTHTRLHAAAKLLPSDPVCSTGIDFGKSAQNFRVPRLFDIRFRLAIMADHEIMRQLRTLTQDTILPSDPQLLEKVLAGMSDGELNEIHSLTPDTSMQGTQVRFALEFQVRRRSCEAA